MNKLQTALSNDELTDYLLGEKGYAIVYPHYNEILRTDIYSVLKEINELGSERLDDKLHKAFESLVGSPISTFYLLTYLFEYLKLKHENKLEFSFFLNLERLIILLNKYLQSDSLDAKRMFEGFTIEELYDKVINGYIGFLDGKSHHGINFYLEKQGLNKIKFARNI